MNRRKTSLIMKDANFANSNRYKSNKQSYMHLKKIKKQKTKKKPTKPKKKPQTQQPSNQKISKKYRSLQKFTVLHQFTGEIERFLRHCSMLTTKNENTNQISQSFPWSQSA